MKRKIGAVWSHGYLWYVQLPFGVHPCASEALARAFSEAALGKIGPNFARVMGRIA